MNRIEAAAIDVFKSLALKMRYVNESSAPQILIKGAGFSVDQVKEIRLAAQALCDEHQVFVVKTRSGDLSIVAVPGPEYEKTADITALAALLAREGVNFPGSEALLGRAPA